MKRFLMIIVAALMAMSASAQPGGYPSDPSFEMREISCMSEGKRLYGQAFFPTTPGKHPAIIFSHGFNGSYRGAYGLISELAKEGYICYCYDFAGGAKNSRSEGRTQEMSIFTESQNLKDVLEMVRSWENVDRRNIFLVGDSQGGCVSAITAPEVAKKINSIILAFPAFCIPDDGFKMFPTLADVPQEVQVMGLQLGRKYYEDFYGDWEIYDAISKYKGEVLIVHGTNDSLVKPEYSAKAANIYKNCELHLIFGAGHGFRPGEQADLYLGYVRDFLKRNLK